MRMHFVLLSLALLLSSGVAHADRAAIQLRLVTTAGTPLPGPDGKPVTVGPALLPGPLEIVSVERVQSEVRVTLARPSVQAVADVTTRHDGRQLAIVIDGVVVSTPIVRTPIVDGKLTITLRALPDAVALARALERR